MMKFSNHDRNSVRKWSYPYAGTAPNAINIVTESVAGEIFSSRFFIVIAVKSTLRRNAHEYNYYGLGGTRVDARDENSPERRAVQSKEERGSTRDFVNETSPAYSKSTKIYAAHVRMTVRCFGKRRSISAKMSLKGYIDPSAAERSSHIVAAEFS